MSLLLTLLVSQTAGTQGTAKAQGPLCWGGRRAPRIFPSPPGASPKEPEAGTPSAQSLSLECGRTGSQGRTAHRLRPQSSKLGLPRVGPEDQGAEGKDSGPLAFMGDMALS